jgi:tetratricopeptide (TPR) repeat protein
VACHADNGPNNPLGPFFEIVRALTSGRERAKRVLELIRDVAPLVAELIPVVGRPAGTVLKAGATVGVYKVGGGADQVERAADMAAALQHVAGDRSLALLVDDSEWIDVPSTEVIRRVADGIESSSLLVVVGYDTDLVDDAHPLAHVRADLGLQAGVRRITLDDLTLETVESFVQKRYGTVSGGPLAAWLHDVTDGNSLFLAEYVRLLEEQGLLRRGETGWTLDGTIEGEPGAWSLEGALAGLQTPEGLIDPFRGRVAGLENDEKELLENGAVQGRRFLTAVLAPMLGCDEKEVRDRLVRLAQRRRMVSPDSVEDWWTDRSSLYSFDPGVLQELLYSRFAADPHDKRMHHAEVAKALEDLVAGDEPPPRQALLTIARHYEQAGRPLEAAEKLVEVARSTFEEGADRETSVHAGRAVDLIRGATDRQLAGMPAVDVSKLKAQAMLYLLFAGEPGWRRDPSPGGGEKAIALAEEAEQAARETGDKALLANVRFARASVLTAFQGLEESIVVYEDALELAREAGDGEAQFAILVTYGHHLDSKNLEDGRKQLELARELITDGALAGKFDETRLARERARLDSKLGVAAFDLGHFGEALELLPSSFAALRVSPMRYDAAWAAAFLGHLQTNIGQYEAGEQTLRDGIELLAEHAGTVWVRGYLRAMLGRLYAEWGAERLAEARVTLADGRAEVRASESRPTIGLVEGYWAELLLAEGTEEARHEAAEVLRELTPHGWSRSEIAAGALRARIALLEGRADVAVELSTQAVQVLDDHKGAVPAVRSEEILFTHARALEAAGNAESARDAYARAARIVRDKAESLASYPEQRDTFLTRVWLTREVLAAAPAETAAAPAGD